MRACASAVLLATGAHLPGEPIDNETLARVAGPLPDEVLEGIQVKTRHWIADPYTGEQSESNSQMAAKAGGQALERAGVEPGEVDLLVVSTASPEYHLPPSSTLVQEHMGLGKIAAIDIRSGCAGAVEALDVARLYLERGDFGTALVIGSETISPLTVPVFLGKDPEKVRMRDRLGIYNFGDGAGAMVLRGEEGEGRGILGSAIRSTGPDRKPGMQVIGGATHAPIAKQLEAKRLIELKVDVVESGRQTPYVLTEGLSDTLEALRREGAGDRPVRDPGGQRGLHDRRAARGRPADARVAGAGEQDLREPRAGGRDRLGGGAAGGGLRVDHGQDQARRNDDDPRDRDEQVEVRGDGAPVGR